MMNHGQLSTTFNIHNTTKPAKADLGPIEVSLGSTAPHTTHNPRAHASTAHKRAKGARPQLTAITKSHQKVGNFTLFASLVLKLKIKSVSLDLNIFWPRAAKPIHSIQSLTFVSFEIGLYG